MVGVVVFVLRLDLSREFVALTFPLLIALTAIERYTVRQALHRQVAGGRPMYRTVIVGTDDAVSDLRRHMARVPWAGFSVVASVTGEGADKTAAETVVDVIKGRGGEAVANYDDVSDHAAAKNIIDTAIESFGRLDVLVNNAGILRDKMIFSMPEADFDAVIAVHLKGTWNTMHHASAYWRSESKDGRQPRASIVNTVSSAGLQGQAGQSNYGAAKAGIAAMTIIASLELGRLGVRANCIGPGGFTRMVGQAMKVELKNPEEYTEFNAMNPGNSAAGGDCSTT